MELLMTNDFKLPLVGLGTCYYEFSKENPEAGIRPYRGGLRRLLTTELTPREFYVALQLCDGRSYRDIASKLDISHGRVNNVVMDIYAKLHVHGKNQLRKFVW